jgi:hypothetical protein
MGAKCYEIYGNGNRHICHLFVIDYQYPHPHFLAMQKNIDAEYEIRLYLLFV